MVTTRSCCPCWRASGCVVTAPAGPWAPEGGPRGQGVLPSQHSPRIAGQGHPVALSRRPDQIAHRAAKGSAGGRPPSFDADSYKGRNVVERCFTRLRQSRDLATRYAKRAAYHAAELTIAAIIL